MLVRTIMVGVAAVCVCVLGAACEPGARHNGDRTMDTSALYSAVGAYLEARSTEFDLIGTERKELLEELSAYIREQGGGGGPVRLNFVCTHNSRRSHMSQLWAAAGAVAYGLDVRTYSGGTEDTAFNPRAVAAIERAGFDVEKTSDDRNPVYLVRMGEGLGTMACFSKAYHNPPNPKDGFGAVMVCDSADAACPSVPGATGRFAIPFVDPKVSDGTDAEAATYDERCAQIARELLYVMSRV